MAALLVSGCAGPGWLNYGETAMPRQSRALKQEDEAPAALSATSGKVTTATDGTEPSLAQVLDDLERIKLQNPSDFKVIQSAIEDVSPLFPPQYQQIYKDQMLGVALRQQEQSPPMFPDQSGPTAAQHNLLPAPGNSFVPSSPLTSPAAQIPPPSSLPSTAAPAAYSTNAAAAPWHSTSAVLPAAAVTAHVDDAPAQLPAQFPTQVAATAIQQVPVATAPAEIAPATETAATEVVLEPGQWIREIERALASLNADLARPNLNREERARLEIMRRLLYVVTNRRDEAVSPIDQLDEDEREYWKHQLHGLLVSMDADGKHPTTRRAALALRHLRTATDHLANVSTLDVRNLTFCKEVLSYGEFRVFDSYSFRAKDELVMYVEIDNFAAHPRGDSFETELHSSYEIVDDAGRRVANVVLPVDKQVSNNRRRDYFIAYLITMPSQIAPGSYRLNLTVEDVIGKKSNHAAVDFRIQ